MTKGIEVGGKEEVRAQGAHALPFPRNGSVEKGAEINFDEAKKARDLTSKPKATMHFCFNNNVMSDNN